MDANQPKISFVTSVFNGATNIQRCLDSIAGQTWPHREMVVIDGGSTDGTVEILRANNHLIASWVSEPDRGIYHAWNKALERVTGEWVCFLGCDDYLWEPDVLATAAPHLTSALPDCRVVYGILKLVDRDGGIINSLGLPWEQARPGFRRNMTIPNPSTFYHRDLFEEYGGFDESFRLIGDYEFALRVLTGNEACFIDDLVIAGMEAGGVTENRDHASAMAVEVARARRKNGAMKIPVWLSGRVFRIRLHALMIRLVGQRATLATVNLFRSLTGRSRLPY